MIPNKRKRPGKPRPMNAVQRRAGNALAPRVVGTLSALPDDVRALNGDCDIIELRLDLLTRSAGWLTRAQEIETAGSPVILTLRLRAEGGKWTRPDKERLPALEAGLKRLSAVDVEFRSTIAPRVARLARRLGKVCIVSFHDFERTPPLSELAETVSAASRLGSIVKITTLIRSRADLKILERLLTRRWPVPLCVMGMGSMGTRARASLAAKGSCLVYGYLDRPVAPGQRSAASLVKRLSALLPGYRRARRAALARAALVP